MLAKEQHYKQRQFKVHLSRNLYLFLKVAEQTPTTFWLNAIKMYCPVVGGQKAEMKALVGLWPLCSQGGGAFPLLPLFTVCCVLTQRQQTPISTSTLPWSSSFCLSVLLRYSLSLKCFPTGLFSEHLISSGGIAMEPLTSGVG